MLIHGMDFNEIYRMITVSYREFPLWELLKYDVIVNRMRRGCGSYGDEKVLTRW